MSKNAKWAIVGLLGGIVFMFLLIGAMAHVYSTTAGVIIMLACWWMAGMLMRIWGFGKEKYYDDPSLVVHMFRNR